MHDDDNHTDEPLSGFAALRLVAGAVVMLLSLLLAEALGKWRG